MMMEEPKELRDGTTGDCQLRSAPISRALVMKRGGRRRTWGTTASICSGLPQIQSAYLVDDVAAKAVFCIRLAGFDESYASILS